MAQAEIEMSETTQAWILVITPQRNLPSYLRIAQELEMHGLPYENIVAVPYYAPEEILDKDAVGKIIVTWVPCTDHDHGLLCVCIQNSKPVFKQAYNILGQPVPEVRGDLVSHFNFNADDMYSYELPQNSRQYSQH